MFPQTVQQVKRWLKIVSGFTLLAVGIVMLVTPGPGWLAIAAGLALLAAEYVWAQRLLQRMKTQGKRLRNAVMPSKKAATGPASKPLPTPLATSDFDAKLSANPDAALDSPADAAAAVKVKD